MMARSSIEATNPLDELKQTSFPKLVVSGGHSAALEAICDVLYRELKSERAVIRGAGHGVPHTGAPLNQWLEAFLNNL
jgi:hypothetical protein